MKKNAYEILGVSPNATDAEIRKQYHTLMRNVHPDSTIGEELSDEQKKENEKLVRAYNDAFEELSKGKRAEYDRKLAQSRSQVIYGEHSSPTSSSGVAWDGSEMKKSTATKETEGEKRQREAAQREAAKRAANKIFDEISNDLFKSIFESGTSFWGSVTPDPNKELRQDYWRLKSEKEKLEKSLRIAEQEAHIEFMNQTPTNEIQLRTDSRNLSSRISSLEVKKTTELRSVEEEYFLKMNKRFMTAKKRQRLLEERKQEEDRINAKYNLLLEQYDQKRVKLDMDLMNYQNSEKKAIANDPKVQTIKSKLQQIKGEIEIISVKLGYQTQTASYTSGYHATK